MRIELKTNMANALYGTASAGTIINLPADYARQLINDRCAVPVDAVPDVRADVPAPSPGPDAKDATDAIPPPKRRGRPRKRQ